MCETMTEQYEKMDTCYGTVTGCNRSGAYLVLDNGQDAFSYKFANLKVGTNVMCTVLKKATENKNVLVSIDSSLVDAIA